VNDLSPGLSGRAAQLRLGFDRSFAEPLRAEGTSTEDFLAVSIASASYAIRCAEISGLIADKKITRVPTNTASLLGLGGFRGAVLPIYSLAALLGHPQTRWPRWVVIAADMPIALAFESLEGNFRVARDCVAPRKTGESDRPFVREFLREREHVWAILHLPSILETVRTRK
jgi:purine-binding chemotaxis protein CheW